MDDLDQRGEAVGGARRVGNDIEIGGVLLLVDTAHKHGGILRRGRDNNLLGAAGEVEVSLLLEGEDAGGLDDVLRAGGGPRDLGGVAAGEDGDGVAVDNELAVLRRNFAFVAAVRGVVLEHVSHIGQVDKGVVDGNDSAATLLEGCAQNKAAAGVGRRKG